jgi:hypothetical protein
MYFFVKKMGVSYLAINDFGVHFTRLELGFDFHKALSLELTQGSIDVVRCKALHLIQAVSKNNGVLH